MLSFLSQICRVDKYMNFGFVRVGVVAIACVILAENGLLFIENHLGFLFQATKGHLFML